MTKKPSVDPFKAQYLCDWTPANTVFSLQELRALRLAYDEAYVRFLASLHYATSRTDRHGDPRVLAGSDEYEIDALSICNLKRRAAELMEIPDAK